MEKTKVFEEIKQWYSSEDLDRHVHEIMSMQATMINNEGIDAQLEYLADRCGIDWLVEVFLDE